MKILYLNSSDSDGGAARACYRIMNSVNKFNDVESRMLVRNKKLEDANIISIYDFQRNNFGEKLNGFIWKIENRIRKSKWKKYPEKENVFLNDLVSVSFYDLLDKLNFDILHLHFVANRFLNLKELQKVHKPIVWTLHDSWAFTGICHYFYDCEKYKDSCGDCPFLQSGLENDLSRQIWKKKNKIYQGIDLHIVTPSHWLGNAAKQSSLFGKYPVSVIPNPIDTKLFCPGNREEARKLIMLDPDKTYILYGAMNAVEDKNKGFKELIKSLNIFENSELKNKTELLVFGVEENRVEISVPITVKYLGMINNDETIVNIYRSADVIIVPSLSENLSNTIMESLSCGTPVVAFDIGGNRDMIEHRRNGYLAKEKNTEDLGMGILWCLENNKTGKLSANARKKVEGNFTTEIVAKEYLELYQQIINK